MKYSVAFRTIAYKEVRRFARIWPQTILPPAITTSLYFLIFGTLIGKRIGEMNGISYMDYIVPGIILMSVISNSYSNVVSSFYSTKFQKHIEEILVAPVPNWVILAGYVSGGVARGACVGLIVSGVSMTFSDFPIERPDIVVAVLFATSLLFSLAGFINATFAKSFDDISIIPNFVLTPLTYLGGVFYTIDLLPEIWQTISLANPILYMVNAFRFGFFGVSDINIVTAFAIILGFIVLLVVISLFLLHKGIGLKT